MNVSLGLEERPVRAMPGRRLTLAGLSWATAAAATILACGTAVLSALGRDVLSAFLVPIALAYAWMGCVLLARRPGHPMGPLLCLIGLVNAVAYVTFAYARYTVVHAPGSLPFGTAILWTITWIQGPAA